LRAGKLSLLCAPVQHMGMVLWPFAASRSVPKGKAIDLRRLMLFAMSRSLGWEQLVTEVLLPVCERTGTRDIYRGNRTQFSRTAEGVAAVRRGVETRRRGRPCQTRI
jgi:hypothetical protein